MYADMGMQVIGAVGGYLSAAEDAKLATAMRKYQQKMSALSAAIANNGITRNIRATQDQAVYADTSIQSAALKEQADAAVEAAAAGIIGNSVNVTSVQLSADEARAQTSRKMQFTQQMQTYGDQRKSLALDRIFSRDISPIAQPRIGSTLLSLGKDLIDTRDAHVTPDRQTFRMSR